MTRLGLEHEYEVRRDGELVDFRHVVHQIDLPGRGLDPIDPFAHRLQSGAVITADGAEAEVAVPPVVCARGFTSAIDAWAHTTTATLFDALAPGASLRGVSTHLSVEVPDRLTLPVCGLFARRFAAPFMLMIDGPESPGLLVRPRFRRVELGAGFAAGPHLRAAAALAVGGLLACTAVAAGRARMRSLPRPIALHVEGARARFGWYIDRTAFGPDLYSVARSTRLRTGWLRTTSAQQQFEHAWAVARAALVRLGVASDDDLADADALAEGRMALHCESMQATLPFPAGGTPPRSSLGDVLEIVERRGCTARAVVSTWDYTVLEIDGPRTVLWSIPTTHLDGFLHGLRAGLLDDLLIRATSAGVEHPDLRSHVQAMGGGTFRSIDPGAVLGPPERAYDGSYL